MLKQHSCALAAGQDARHAPKACGAGAQLCFDRQAGHQAASNAQVPTVQQHFIVQHAEGSVPAACASLEASLTGLLSG